MLMIKTVSLDKEDDDAGDLEKDDYRQSVSVRKPHLVREVVLERALQIPTAKVAEHLKGRKEERKKGRKEERKKGRKEGRKEGRQEKMESEVLVAKTRQVMIGISDCD
jgi:flagellar biosynthesis/type III secretory pathway protein FliH